MKWLLDSDPAIRWQVMRDLSDETDEVVAAERSRVASEGWGAQLLNLQEPDGNWGGGAWAFKGWASTMETLVLLRELGLDPASPQGRKAISLVRDKSNWGPEFGHAPFFEGEVEPCHWRSGNILFTCPASPNLLLYLHHFGRTGDPPKRPYALNFVTNLVAPPQTSRTSA
jgi:hypothetical protein